MAFGTVGLKTHIWNNNARSVMLLAAYPFVIAAMVWAVGAAFGYIWEAGVSGDARSSRMAVAMGNGVVLEYWPLILTVVALWFMVAYFFHTRMLRTLSHARPVTRIEEPELYNLVENLCISQGVPMPKLEIIETRARNAFASGIDNKSYTITVTRGLLQSLEKDEVEGVLAHELTHIINRDVRLLIVSIIFTGMIGFIAQLAWSSFRYNLYLGGGRGGRRDGRIMVIVLVVMAILWVGYIATVFTRFALSRRREYMADAGAVEMTKNPDAMMRALLRIAKRDRIPETTDDVALMCTVNSKPFLGLFATHPPIEQRVQIISEVTGTPIPDMRAGERTDDDQRFVTPNEGKPNPWLSRRNKGE
ncbi:MAG: M48 family metallopeptidase [Rhodospirillales bacterium]|nr:M48 family metallopeptidase [Rhodospirillales bacterium]